MGMILSLRKAVDGKVLQDVVEELRVRYPYFYVKATVMDGRLTVVPNPLPMTVRNTWEPINLNSEDSNYHLAAWKYEGRRLAFEIPHSMTDSAGVMPYLKSAMYLYLSKTTGMSFDPSGFRLPGDVIPESETGDPFRHVDFDGVKSPLYSKDPIRRFFRLVNRETPVEKKVFFLKLSETQVMRFCRNNGGSPNVFFSVMMAKAARRYDPASRETITVSVAINQKAMLGNYDNYHLSIGAGILDFPKETDMDDIRKVLTTAHGQLILQAQPENSIWEIKQQELSSAPPSDKPQASICVSYPTDRSFGPLDPYIREFFICTSLSRITDVLCEVTCLNHNFFVAFMQPFPSESYLGCFLEELSLAGIGCTLLGSEPLRMCGIER